MSNFQFLVITIIKLTLIENIFVFFISFLCMWVSLQYHSKIFKNMKGIKRKKRIHFCFVQNQTTLWPLQEQKEDVWAIMIMLSISSPPNEQFLKVIRYRVQNTKQNYWQWPINSKIWFHNDQLINSEIHSTNQHARDLKFYYTSSPQLLALMLPPHPQCGVD